MSESQGFFAGGSFSSSQRVILCSFIASYLNKNKVTRGGMTRPVIYLPWCTLGTCRKGSYTCPLLYHLWDSVQWTRNWSKRRTDLLRFDTMDWCYSSKQERKSRKIDCFFDYFQHDIWSVKIKCSALYWNTKLASVLQQWPVTTADVARVQWWWQWGHAAARRDRILLAYQTNGGVLY